MMALREKRKWREEAEMQDRERVMVYIPDRVLGPS